MPEQYVNSISTTLLNPITTTTQTSIFVSSTIGFPSSPSFRILIGSEIMLVSAMVGTLWTVLRAQEGTSPNTYIAGMGVDHLLTAGAWDQMRIDMCNSGTYASRGTGTKPGDLYIPTDSFYDMLRWSGSGWDHFRMGRLLTPPVLANFTFDNLKSATTSAVNGGLWGFESPGTGGLRFGYMTAPATPYTITTGFLPHYSSVNNTNIGIGWREASTGKINQCGVSYSSGWQLRNYKWTTSNAWSADYSAIVLPYSMAQSHMVWMQMSNDGTNRYLRYSSNGVNWTPIQTVAYNDFLTPTQVGFGFGDVNSAGGDAGITLLHWLQT